MAMHIPVLTNEVLHYLDPKPNENFIDATVGFAGHTREILKRNGPNGQVLGIEWSSRTYWELRSQNIARLILENDSFCNLKEIADRQKFQPVQGILFDLGLSSWHLEKSGRGFSFQKTEPLDMRMGSGDLTAEIIVNQWPEKELTRIFKEFGEERFSQRIAQRIAEHRTKEPLKTTAQLVEVVKSAVPKKYQFGRLHPSTRIFQALRIAVNNELDNLKTVLPLALEVVSPGGKIVAISFHSLEDRIVKHFFKDKAKEGQLTALTKKPIQPTELEIRNNPRARSAKLRAAQKI